MAVIVSERVLMAAARANRAQAIVSGLRGLLELAMSVDDDISDALLVALGVAARVCRDRQDDLAKVDA